MSLLDFSYNYVPLIYSLVQVASMLPEEAFSVIRKSFDARKVLSGLISSLSYLIFVLLHRDGMTT
jgi:hypothetical protein